MDKETYEAATSLKDKIKMIDRILEIESDNPKKFLEEWLTFYCKQENGIIDFVDIIRKKMIDLKKQAEKQIKEL